MKRLKDGFQPLPEKGLKREKQKMRMKYLIRTTSARVAVTHYGKKDYVTRIEFLKTDDERIIKKANAGKSYKFQEINKGYERTYYLFLRKAEKNTIYYNEYNEFCRYSRMWEKLEKIEK